MKSKEEILGKWLTNPSPDDIDIEFGCKDGAPSDKILKAMNEHAQQCSIGFAQWIIIEEWEELAIDQWYKESSRDENGDPKYFTIEQLFNLYLNSLNQ